MNALMKHLLLGLLLISLPSIPTPIEVEQDPIVLEMLTESDPSRWVNWIRALSGDVQVQTKNGEGTIRTRSSYVLFEPNQVPSAFVYLQEELESLGFKNGQDFKVHTYDFPYSDQHRDRNWKNLILTLPGADPNLSKTRVLLVAHLDSTSDQERTLAPGADDNGSGAAGLMEAAALLRHYQFDRTIHLIWFSGEEQSRRGSEHFVLDYADWLPDVVGVINLDMFAFDWDNDRCFEIHAGTLPESQQIGALFQEVIETYQLDLTFDFIDDENAYTFSDHFPFWQEGVPGVMVFENGFYQEGETCGTADRNYRYHTTADTMTYINQDTGFSILQASIAALAYLAQPVGPCFSQAPQVYGHSDHSRIFLKWDPLENAEGYTLWFEQENGWQVLGETLGTTWVHPLPANHRVYKYQVIAYKKASNCQSQPGSYQFMPVNKIPKSIFWVDSISTISSSKTLHRQIK